MIENRTLTTGRSRRFVAAILATTMLVSVAACQTTGKEGQGTAAGAGIGGILGGVIGNQFGGTSGAIVGALVGVAAGAYIGGEIGRYLDEQDKKKAAENSIAAIEKSERNKGKPATSEWTSDKNPGVSGAATAQAVSDDCYVVQEVAVIPGQGDVRQQTQYCNQGGEYVAV